jgi:uncharacterized protein YbjT (DUF2867 family)
LKVVTGAFSFTGSYIARELLDRGEIVRTLSRQRPRADHPLAGSVAFGRLQFEDDRALEAELAGADTLYNTYWIRSPHGGTDFDTAVVNSLTLLAAAERAGVRRVVHLGVSNSSPDSALPYFRAKAEVDGALRARGLSHAIIRPTLIFGAGDVLINNIAWCLRRFPVFLVPGRGDYALQPVAAEDVASLAADAGERSSNEEFDAAGPISLRFGELVGQIRRAIGSGTPMLNVPPKLALAGAAVAGAVHRDTMLSAQELNGLMAGLLASGESPRGTRRLEDWLATNAGALGRRYVSERLRNWSAG